MWLKAQHAVYGCEYANPKSDGKLTLTLAGQTGSWAAACMLAQASAC
jgi:hypothetical protein